MNSALNGSRERLTPRLSQPLTSCGSPERKRIVGWQTIRLN